MGKKESNAAENVKVLVRCRPLSEKEKSNGHTTCVDLDLAAHTVTVKSLIGEPDRWTFDAVINNSFSQKDIFTQFIMPLTDSVLDGFNATVFAYGQSGSGKTHTMTGVMGDPTLEGVTPRCFQHIFESIKKMKDTAPGRSFNMYVSFLELYNGKVRDLLAKQQVSLDIRQAKDQSFFVQGAVVAQVKFPEDILRHLEEGTERRRTASTELNADSSRSHSIFSLILECVETLEDGSTCAVSSKLNLVDLAGSERQGKTGASGDTLKEGCNINLSLSALGTVIDTIVKGGAHIPFRSSPLTMLLKDSLGGNSKTVMFANINPSERNLSETVSTLRFADRAKQIKNKPVVNMDSKDQKIAELVGLVNEMKEKLKKYETEGTSGLEREVEELRERTGELEVQLDNAVKGREADLVDYENLKASIAQERQHSTAKLVDMEEQLGQLQENLQVAEGATADVKGQLGEVLQLCASYLVSAEEKKESPAAATIADVAALTVVLKKVQKQLREGGTGAGGEGEANAQQLQTLQAEHATAMKGMKRAQKELQAQLAESQASVEKLLAKAKKMKSELDDAKKKKSTGDAGGGAAVAAVYKQQEEALLEAMKLDDQGVAAIKVLQEQKEALQAQLVAAQQAGPKSRKSSVTPTTPTTTTAAGPTVEELEEAKAKAVSLEAAKQRLEAELSTVEAAAAQHETEVAALQQAFDQRLRAADDATEEVGRLEKTLRERTDQLDQLRALLEKQKGMIVKGNERAEHFQDVLRTKNAELGAVRDQYRQQLEDKDAQMQQTINKRVEEYMTQRDAEMEERAHTFKKLKRKVQKAQEGMTDWEAQYDKKVCECEDLRNALAEQKMEHLKLLRQMEDPELADRMEVEEQKEQIANALERAKMERKRKNDLFSMGEVQNAKRTSKKSSVAGL